MNLANVFRSTLQILAILRFDTLAFNSSRIRFSFPNSLYLSGEFFRPFGRPKVVPSAFFRANASFVRWEIRLRSISADKPKQSKHVRILTPNEQQLVDQIEHNSLNRLNINGSVLNTHYEEIRDKIARTNQFAISAKKLEEFLSFKDMCSKSFREQRSLYLGVVQTIENSKKLSLFK